MSKNLFLTLGIELSKEVAQSCYSLIFLFILLRNPSRKKIKGAI